MHYKLCNASLATQCSCIAEKLIDLNVGNTLTVLNCEQPYSSLCENIIISININVSNANTISIRIIIWIKCRNYNAQCLYYEMGRKSSSTDWREKYLCHMSWQLQAEKMPAQICFVWLKNVLFEKRAVVDLKYSALVGRVCRYKNSFRISYIMCKLRILFCKSSYKLMNVCVCLQRARHSFAQSCDEKIKDSQWICL